MFIQLIPHPTTTFFTNLQLQARVQYLANGDIQLHYVLQGDLTSLRIPPPQPARAVDGLWQHTCLEAFFAAKNTQAYREFNFSPSSQWAAYAFKHYRIRESAWQIKKAPLICCEQVAEALTLNVTIDAEDLPIHHSSLDLLIGLSAVLEAKDGSKSYWAICHPNDQPDFHHSGGFVELAK